MSDNKELKVVVAAGYDAIEVREGLDKIAGRSVSDVDHVQASGKEAYGRRLDEAIDFLWGKVRENVAVDSKSKTSVERAAAYYAMVDNAVSSIVTSDATASISTAQIAELDAIRSSINGKHREILASVVANHVRPSEDECTKCGSLLFDSHCVLCEGESGPLVKEAASPKLDFHESGFIVGIATDISNYVVTSGMNLNDAINIAKDSFSLDPREEYRLRKYLGYMGHMAPQMIWLPASETRYA